MTDDRTQLTRQQQEWIATIEADPDLFVALAENTGLADKLRQRLNEPQGQRNDPSTTSWESTRALQQRTDQRNALARVIVQNAQGAGIHESTLPFDQKQEMRMVDLVRLAHELGSRAIQGNQAIRQRDALLSRLYEVGIANGLIDNTPNPESPTVLQSSDAHGIINDLETALIKGHQAAQQRDMLADAVSDAAHDASMVNPGTELSGMGLLMLIKEMGDAAKVTVDRNAMLAKGPTNPNSVPEVTDNVMRKVNRAIGELTGNKHIGVTAKVVIAVWDALKEDAGLAPKPTGGPTTLPDTAAQHFDRLSRIYSDIQNGNKLVTDADFAEQLEVFAAAVVDSGIARANTPGQTPFIESEGAMSEKEKAHINNAIDILSRVGPRGMTSPGAMAALQTMVDNYHEGHRTNTPNTQNQLLDELAPEDDLTPGMG